MKCALRIVCGALLAALASGAPALTFTEPAAAAPALGAPTLAAPESLALAPAVAASAATVALAPAVAAAEFTAPLASGQVMATNELEYSYSTATQREIVEDWLDVGWSLGELRAGILFNHQAPAEEGTRANMVRHRFVEFPTHGLELRAGHFYGMFGRGLLFAAREDRRIRVDTALDGLLVSGRRGPLRGTMFTGTPSQRAVDVRGVDAEAQLGHGWALGGSGLTWRADDGVRADGSVRREWVTAPRLTATLPCGGLYAEYGWKRGWDFEAAPDDAFQGGHAFYGSLQLFRGPLGLALEAKDYRRFAVLRGADGRTPLNDPPSLTREHLYTLLNRAPQAVDADGERGQQAELTWECPGGWSALFNASRTEQPDGTPVFEEAYAQFDHQRLGAFSLRSGFGYRESEGLRQTVVAEVGWRLDSRRSLALEVEHQHVRLGGGVGFDLGAYDEEFLKLEFSVAPAWSAAAILEVNNKYVEQRVFGEQAGPFPAAQLDYTTADGARLALWAGRRQAGYLCAGGVCKYEPAFEGVELTVTLRY